MTDLNKSREISGLSQNSFNAPDTRSGALTKVDSILSNLRAELTTQISLVLPSNAALLSQAFLQTVLEFSSQDYRSFLAGICLLEIAPSENALDIMGAHRFTPAATVALNILEGLRQELINPSLDNHSLKHHSIDRDSVTIRGSDRPPTFSLRHFYGEIMSLTRAATPNGINVLNPASTPSLATHLGVDRNYTIALQSEDAFQIQSVHGRTSVNYLSDSRSVALKNGEFLFLGKPLKYQSLFGAQFDQLITLTGDYYVPLPALHRLSRAALLLVREQDQLFLYDRAMHVDNRDRPALTIYEYAPRVEKHLLRELLWPGKKRQEEPAHILGAYWAGRDNSSGTEKLGHYVPHA